MTLASRPVAFLLLRPLPCLQTGLPSQSGPFDLREAGCRLKSWTSALAGPASSSARVRGDIRRRRSARGLQSGSADRWTTLLIPAPGTGHPAVASTRCSACVKRVRWGSAQPPGDARSAAQPCRSLPQFRPMPKGPFLPSEGKRQHSLLILQPCQRGSALPQPASRCITPLPPGPNPFGQPSRLRCWREAGPLPKEPGPAAVVQRGAAISSPVKHGRGETRQGTGCW